MSKLPNVYLHETRTWRGRVKDICGYVGSVERDYADAELYIPAARLRELVEKQEKLRWSYKTLIEELEALLKEPGE